MRSPARPGETERHGENRAEAAHGDGVHAHHPSEEDVSQHEEGHAASEQPHPGMAFEQLPDPGGDQHDARDQREVRVPVAEQAHARALLGLGRDELVRGAPVLAVEIAPPQRSDQHQRQHHADQPFALEARVGSARAHRDRDHRLTERDQDDPSVALGEMRGVQREAPLAPQDRRRDEERRRREEQQPHPARVDERSSDQKGGSAEIERRHAENRHPGRTLSLQRKGAEMQQHHEKIRKPERQRACAEHLRNRQRHHQKPRHRGDQHQPHLPGHADIVRQPGITRVHPPDRHQHQQRPQKIHRPVSVLHQLGDLRDDEDENQIEEELDRRNAGGFFVRGGGHGR